jgi:hypothetical protein
MAVYFLAADGLPLVRIGCSKMPTNRLMTCQSWSPVRLSLAAIDEAGDLLTEGELLRRLSKFRSHGDWFHTLPPVREVVAITAATGCIPGAWYMPPGTGRRKFPGGIYGPSPAQITAAFGITRREMGDAVGSKNWQIGGPGIPIGHVAPIVEYLRQSRPTLTLAEFFAARDRPALTEAA